MSVAREDDEQVIVSFCSLATERTEYVGTCVQCGAKIAVGLRTTHRHLDYCMDCGSVWFLESNA